MRDPPGCKGNERFIGISQCLEVTATWGARQDVWQQSHQVKEVVQKNLESQGVNESCGCAVLCGCCYIIIQYRRGPGGRRGRRLKTWCWRRRRWTWRQWRQGDDNENGDDIIVTMMLVMMRNRTIALQESTLEPRGWEGSLPLCLIFSDVDEIQGLQRKTNNMLEGPHLPQIPPEIGK